MSYGYKKEEVIGKSLLEFVPEKYWPMTSKHLADLANGKSTEGEIEIKTKKGTLMAELRSSPVKEKEKIVGFQSIVRDITRQKLVEEELRESEEKYRLIFENSPDGIITLDLMGNVKSVNDVVLSYGYKKEDLIGRSFLEFVPFVSEKHRPILDKHVASVTSGKIVQGEMELSTPKGMLTMWFRASPMKKMGEVVGFQLILIDITKRKKAEEALKKSEQKLRDVIDTSPDGIVWVDTTGKITLFNKKGFEITGFSEKDIIGKNFVDVGVLTPESKRKILEAFMKRIKGINTPPYEIEFVAENGEIIPIELSASPIYEGGKIVGTQSILRDLRERKTMEEKLGESEERLRNLYESIPDALAVYVGREGCLIEYNQAFKKWCGYPDEELKDKAFLDFVHLDDRATVLEKYRTEYSEEELPLVYEIKGINKKGEIIPTEISVGTYKKKGRVIGINVMHRDITERKEMERKLQEYAEHLEDMVEERTKELRESQERLIKSERLATIGQLATMVGHDLRNPLSAIQNACYYLKMKLGASKDEKVEKMFGIIDKEINYANNIVKDLMDFSRVKKPDLKKIDLISSIQDTISQLKFPENVTLTTKFSEVPVIEADPDQLRRIFQNITLNGARAMPDGGELTISTRKNGDFVEAAFTDTGVGIPEENMDKLFVPLFTTKAQGVGLGLSICKNLVDGHNGRIEVKSKVGEGSTFTIKLPIHQNNGGEKQT